MNDKIANERDAGIGPVEEIEALVTVEEAARRLGLKTPTLYGWIEEGKFEGLKLGTKAIRIRPAAIREFLEAAQKQARVRAA